MSRRTDTVAGIVLAGGGGRRLGTAKALVEFDGRPLVERGVRTLADGGCEPVLAVLGAAADEVRRACALGDDVVVVVNEAWEQGLGGSVRAGLVEAERRGAMGAVMLPVDQPLVTPALVGRLIGAWRDGALAAVAAYGTDLATPVLLDRSLWSDVASSAVGDVGARAFLRSHPGLVTPVACEDVGDASDVDTEEDLRWIESLAGRPPGDRLRRHLSDRDR